MDNSWTWNEDEDEFVEYAENIDLKQEKAATFLKDHSFMSALFLGNVAVIATIEKDYDVHDKISSKKNRLHVFIRDKLQYQLSTAFYAEGE
jgi:hypothetical protein